MRQLLHLEIATAEQESRQAKETRVATRDENASARLVVLLLELSGSALDARVRGAARRPRHAVADLETAAPALAGGHLDDLPRAATRHGSPRADLVLDPDDDLVGVEEDGVDREAHERRVDAPARPQHHALALAQVLPAEETAHPAMGAIRDDDALADDPAILPAERQRCHVVGLPL